MAEHHSSLVPWQLVAAKTGAVIKHVTLTQDTQELDMKVGCSLLGSVSGWLSCVQCSCILQTSLRPSSPITVLLSSGYEANAPVVQPSLYLKSCRTKTSDALCAQEAETKSPLSSKFLQHFKELLSPKTKVVSLVHVSNMLGSVLDTDYVVEEAHKVGGSPACIVCVGLSQILPSIIGPSCRDAKEPVA